MVYRVHTDRRIEDADDRIMKCESSAIIPSRILVSSSAWAALIIICFSLSIARGVYFSFFKFKEFIFFLLSPKLKIYRIDFLVVACPYGLAAGLVILYPSSFFLQEETDEHPQEVEEVKV